MTMSAGWKWVRKPVSRRAWKTASFSTTRMKRAGLPMPAMSAASQGTMWAT